MADEDRMPLPKGWIRTFSNSQKRYYYSHKDTKHTQWHFPTASEAADPWMAKRRAEGNHQKDRKRSGGGAMANNNTDTKKPSAADDDNDAPSSKKSRTSGPNAVVATGPVAPAPSRKYQHINEDESLLLASLADTTNVAIIVPYRDLHVEQKRAAHLRAFVPHMMDFLGHLVKQQRLSDFHIYIIDQSDDGRKFNRGKLLNIGFDLAKKRNQQHDVFIFHDVDLLPQPDLAEAYATFPKTPYHIARVWDRYSNNPKYFGGVVAFSASDFKRINGYPNTFWGWGGEDDELQLRCQAIGLQWDWPRRGGTLLDLEEMTLNDKLQFLREHKEWKCMVKWEALKEHEETWRNNGLADLQYKVLNTVPLLEGSSSSGSGNGKATKVTVDVKLNGDHWANDKCSVDFMGDWNNHQKN